MSPRKTLTATLLVPAASTLARARHRPPAVAPAPRRFDAVAPSRRAYSTAVRGPGGRLVERTFFDPVRKDPTSAYTMVFHATADFQGRETWFIEQLPADAHTGATAYDGVGSHPTPFGPDVFGQLLGLGLQDRAYAGLQEIRALAPRVGPPRTINCVGWSRGAVTIIHIANKVGQDPYLRSRVRLNLFLIDPVPGGVGFGANHQHWVDLDSRNPALEACKIIYAQHDHLRGFAPLLPTPSPKIEVDVMPGSHGSIVEASTPEGRLTFSQTVEFLSRHGTRFNRLAPLDAREKIELYEQLLAKFETYTQAMGRGSLSTWAVAQRKQTRSGSYRANGQIDANHTSVINRDHSEALRALGRHAPPPSAVPGIHRLGRG